MKGKEWEKMYFHHLLLSNLTNVSITRQTLIDLDNVKNYRTKHRPDGWRR